MRSERPGPRPGPVLVVDDEPDIVTFVRLALEDEGYGVVTAANGAEALEVLRVTNPSLILLDLRMPGMGGREFVETYRARETTSPPVPIIVVTASRLPEVDPAEMGASGVLRKPFEVDLLLESVAQYIRATS
jgi:CheY-like chemotaxis protein